MQQRDKIRPKGASDFFSWFSSPIAPPSSRGPAAWEDDDEDDDDDDRSFRATTTRRRQSAPPQQKRYRRWRAEEMDDDDDEDVEDNDEDDDFDDDDNRSVRSYSNTSNRRRWRRSSWDDEDEEEDEDDEDDVDDWRSARSYAEPSRSRGSRHYRSWIDAEKEEDDDDSVFGFHPRPADDFGPKASRTEPMGPRRPKRRKSKIGGPMGPSFDKDEDQREIVVDVLPNPPPDAVFSYKVRRSPNSGADRSPPASYGSRSSRNNHNGADNEDSNKQEEYRSADPIGFEKDSDDDKEEKQPTNKKAYRTASSYNPAASTSAPLGSTPSPEPFGPSFDTTARREHEEPKSSSSPPKPTQSGASIPNVSGRTRDPLGPSFDREDSDQKEVVVGPKPGRSAIHTPPAQVNGGVHTTQSSVPGTTTAVDRNGVTNKSDTTGNDTAQISNEGHRRSSSYNPTGGYHASLSKSENQATTVNHSATPQRKTGESEKKVVIIGGMAVTHYPTTTSTAAISNGFAESTASVSSNVVAEAQAPSNSKAIPNSLASFLSESSSNKDKDEGKDSTASLSAYEQQLRDFLSANNEPKEEHVSNVRQHTSISEPLYSSQETKKQIDETPAPVLSAYEQQLQAFYGTSVPGYSPPSSTSVPPPAPTVVKEEIIETIPPVNNESITQQQLQSFYSGGPPRRQAPSQVTSSVKETIVPQNTNQKPNASVAVNPPGVSPPFPM